MWREAIVQLIAIHVDAEAMGKVSVLSRHTMLTFSLGSKVPELGVIFRFIILQVAFLTKHTEKAKVPLQLWPVFFLCQGALIPRCRRWRRTRLEVTRFLCWGRRRRRGWGRR